MFGALLALSFATKESTFITIFVAGSFFLVAIACAGARPAACARRRSCARCSAPGWEAGRGASPRSWRSTRCCSPTFLTHPSGIYGLWTGLDYWLGQHGVGRGGESPGFYSVVLFAHEWPVLLLGAVGAVAAFRRPTLLRLFLVWAFVLSLAVYSWAGEKFAWLVLHPLLPLILLAGVGLQGSGTRAARLARQGRARRHRAGARLHGLRLRARQRRPSAPTRASSSSPRSPRPTSPTGRREIVALAERRGRQAQDHDRLGGGRDVPVGLVLPRPRRRLPRHVAPTRRRPSDSDVIILTQASNTRLQPTLTGYDGRQFHFRVWWVRDYGAMSAGNWWRWFTAPQALEPDRRDAGVALRAAGGHRRRLGRPNVNCAGEGRGSAGRGANPAALPFAPRCRSQTVVPSRSKTRSPELVPLGDPGVAVVGALDRPDDDVADPVAVEQRTRGVRGRVRRVHRAHVVGARGPGRASTGARARPSRSRSAAR